MLKIGLSLFPQLRSLWNPSELFPNAEKGFWPGGYDPASGRLWQDNSGTTAATTFGQPIGRVASLTPSGLYATQSTSLARPTLARWPRGGRRNLLTGSEALSLGPSSNGGSQHVGTASAYAGELPPGISAAIQVKETTASGSHFFRLGFGKNFVGQHTFSIMIKPLGRTRFQVLPERVGTSLWAGATVNLVTKSIENKIERPSQVCDIATINELDNGWFRVRITYTPSVERFSDDYNGVLFCFLDDVVSGAKAAQSYAGDADKGCAVTGWQIEPGAEVTPYQKVTTDYDVSEAGVESLWHLYDDGGDSLPVVLPVGNYGVAYVDHLGQVTFGTVTSDGVTAIDTLLVERQLDVIFREGDFSDDEKALIETYWQRIYAA